MGFKPALEAAVCCAILFMTPVVAHAAWPADPSANVPLCTADHAQIEPAITSDGAGGAIVTWQDTRKTSTTGSSSDADIFAQRVDATGTPRWAMNGIGVCTAIRHQMAPSIVSDGAGGALIFWSDFRGGAGLVTYAQRVDASGAPQWAPDGVVLCKAFGGQMNLSAVSDGAGGAIVVWQDYRSGSSFNIYAQRIDGAGVARWSNDCVAVCSAAGAQAQPAIASDGAGGAIVVWEDAREGAAGIYAQRVDTNGALQWTADGVTLCAVSHDAAGLPAIAHDGAGGAVVAWEDHRGSVTHVMAQRVDSHGTPQWATNGIALSRAPGEQLQPSIATDDSGGVMIAWEDRRNPMNTDICAQRVNAAGAFLWSADGLVLCASSSDQTQPSIIADGARGAIVAWEDDRDGTIDIYAQRVSATGSPSWANGGLAVCKAAYNQVHPRLVSDGAGGAIMTWQDSRSGERSWDIYAQQVDRAGKLGGSGQ